MSEPFVAEIRIFAGDFSPRGWAFCNGQLLPISQNTALFSLIGTTYGGDGRTTTALPNMQGRAPMHPGTGPGLTSRRLGQRGGAESATLTEAQIPSHTHNWNGIANPANDDDPMDKSIARPTGLGAYTTEAPDISLHEDALALSGESQPHNNMQPYLAINYIIALVGLYPSRG